MAHQQLQLQANPHTQVLTTDRLDQANQATLTLVLLVNQMHRAVILHLQEVRAAILVQAVLEDHIRVHHSQHPVHLHPQPRLHTLEPQIASQVPAHTRDPLPNLTICHLTQGNELIFSSQGFIWLI